MAKKIYAQVAKNKRTAAEIVDNESHVTPVHTLKDDDVDAPIIPGAVIVDADVKEAPIKAGAVINPDAENYTGTSPEDVDLKPAGEDVEEGDEDAPAEEAEEELESREPTRYGRGRETLVGKEENPGDSRHQEMINPAFVTGKRNEYPR